MRPGLHHMLNLTHEQLMDRCLADPADAIDDARRAGGPRQAVAARYS